MNAELLNDPQKYGFFVYPSALGDISAVYNADSEVQSAL